MANITDIELAAAMHLGDGVSTLSAPISTIVTRLNAVGQAYVQLYIPLAPDAIKNECIVRFASYLYDAPSASADGRFAAAWFNSGASALAAPFMQLSVSGTAELTAGPGQTGMGVDQAAVNALIDAAVFSWAQQGNADLIPAEKLPAGRGGGGGLTSSQVLALIANWAEQGNADLIPLTKLPTLPASKLSGVPTQTALTDLTGRVTDIEAFEDALTYSKELVPNTAVIVAGSRIPYRVQRNRLNPYEWPPDDTAGERFSIDIWNRPQSALVHLGSFESTVHAIYEIPQVDTNTVTQLTGSNSLAFTLSGINFYISRDTSNVIIFSADDIDTYTVHIQDTEPNFAAWTHLNSTTLIPLNRIAALPAPGLSQSAVDARIFSAVPNWAQTRNLHTHLIPLAQLPNIPTSKITGLPAAGLGTTAVQALIADWAETGNTAIVPLNKLPDDEWASAEFEQGLRTGVDYPTGVMTTGGSREVAFRNQGLINLDGSGTFPTWNTINTLADGEFLQLKIERAPWPGNPLVYTDLGTYDVPYGTIEGLTSPNDDPTTLSAGSSHQFNLGSEQFRIAPGATNAEGIALVRLAAGSTGSFRYRLTITKSQPDIQSWARLSSSDLIPATKISGSTSGGLTTTQVQALIADWAEEGNATLIPANKLPSSSGGGVQAARLVPLDYLNTSLRINITASALDYIDTIARTSRFPRTAWLTRWGTPQTITANVGKGVIYTIGIAKIVDVDSSPHPLNDPTRFAAATEALHTLPIGTLEGLTEITNPRTLLTDDNAYKFTATVNGTEETFRIGLNTSSTSPPDRYLFEIVNVTLPTSGKFTFYRIRLYASVIDIRGFAKRSAPVEHLNSTSARGQATVTSANDAAGRTLPFGTVNQVDVGDLVLIELDPATTTDGNAVIFTRIPPSQEDTWVTANVFQSESGVSDDVQLKITNGTSAVSMQLQRGSHSTAPKLIRGTYTLRRINLA